MGCGGRRQMRRGCSRNRAGDMHVSQRGLQDRNKVAPRQRSPLDFQGCFLFFRERCYWCHPERSPPEIPMLRIALRVRLRYASLRMTPSVSGGRSRNPSKARIKRATRVWDLTSFNLYFRRSYDDICITMAGAELILPV